MVLKHYDVSVISGNDWRLGECAGTISSLCLLSSFYLFLKQLLLVAVGDGAGICLSPPCVYVLTWGMYRKIMMLPFLKMRKCKWRS